MWDPSLQVAGLVGVHWTQVGAVEWGCGGRKGYNLEEGYCEDPQVTEVGVEVPTNLSHTIPCCWGSCVSDSKPPKGRYADCTWLSDALRTQHPSRAQPQP